MTPSLLRLAPRSTPTASNHPARSHAPSRAARGGSSTSASRTWLRRSIPASCVALLLLLTASLLRARIRPQSPEFGGCAVTSDGECSGFGGSSEGERPLRVYMVLLPAPYNVDLIPLAQVTRAPRDSPGGTLWPSSPWHMWFDPTLHSLVTRLYSPPRFPYPLLPPPCPHTPRPFPPHVPTGRAAVIAATSSPASRLPALPAVHRAPPLAPRPSPASGGSSGPTTLSPHLLPLLHTPDLPDLPVPLSPSPSPPAEAALPEATAEGAALAGTDGAVDVSVPCYPDYPYYRQHGAEYFLTLSLLSGTPLSLLSGTAAVQRVQRVEEAEAIFLPYWSTLAFRTNASEILDPIIARFAHRHAATLASSAANTSHGSGGSSDSTGSESSGRQAGRMPPLVVPCVYPLAMFNHSLPLAAAIKLAVDLDLHWSQAASYVRDVMVPYVPLVAPFSHDRGSWASRPLLLFFQGTTDRWGGGIIRQQVQRELQGQAGVEFRVGRAENSSMTAQASTAMRQAKYCLVPRGDTSSSCRLFDAILSGCIPVIISDALDPPFEDAIDYSAFSLLLPAALAVRPGYILGVLHTQTEAVWRQQWVAMRKQQRTHTRPCWLVLMHHAVLPVLWLDEPLHGIRAPQPPCCASCCLFTIPPHIPASQVAHHFIYSFPPRPSGAEDMVWRAVARRVRGEFSPRYRNRRGRILLAQLAQAGLNASHLEQPLPNRPPVTFDVTLNDETN
ncbi:unnamed protein product [Closterium sp. NIES-53]